MSPSTDTGAAAGTGGGTGSGAGAAAGVRAARRPPPHPRLTWRTGVEVELLAPRGASRARLARALAAGAGGWVEPVFHEDSEPSLVPGMGYFRHLTQGFQVLDRDGRLRCTVVDDITIVSDLAATALPRPGWYRVVSDDPRLLRLVARHASPGADLEHVLEPVARLFGTSVAERPGGIRRVDDSSGATVAMAAPLPGERERPSEIVTPPLERDHEAVLAGLLEPARELGFTVPAEAAVHLHVDAGPFRSPHAFANLVRLFGHWREPLRQLLGTNPACRRLGPLPDHLVTLVDRTGSPALGWEELRAAAAGTGVTKFMDVNLTRLLGEPPERDTVEVRILPGAIDAAEIVEGASLVERLLQRCLDPAPLPRPTGTGPAERLLEALDPAS